MKKILKNYDVYFTLQSPACVLVEASSEKEAREIAEDILMDMSQEELVERLLAAVAFDGLKVQYIEKVD